MQYAEKTQSNKKQSTQKKPPGKQQTVQRKQNNTGLPSHLKSGIESLSGFSMSDVNVHYNSSKPAQMKALAYAQGTDIHLASGQEKHLPHEAWHVVQQKQGRVKPTMQMKGQVNVNDDAGLEQEADVMGAKAAQITEAQSVNRLAKTTLPTPDTIQNVADSGQVAQRKKVSDGAKVGIEIETTLPVMKGAPIADSAPMQEIRKALTEGVTLGQGAALTKAQQLLGIPALNAHLSELIQNYYDDKDPEGNAKTALAQIGKDNIEIMISLMDKLNIDQVAMEPPGSEVVHKDSLWEAQVDHMPNLFSERGLGNIDVTTGVEIVTNPVKTRAEAAAIMDSSQAWLDTILTATKTGNRHTINGPGGTPYSYVMPPASQGNLLENGKLLGNIQVSVGAYLEDVIDIHQGNASTINRGNPQEYKKWIEDIPKMWDWATVKTTLINKGIQVEDKDEPFLKNIMFMYLYTPISYLLGANRVGGQTEKNRYPILPKTPAPTQIELSSWDKKDEWEDNTDNIRVEFAVIVGLMIFNTDIMRNDTEGKIKDSLFNMAHDEEPVNIQGRNLLDERDELIVEQELDANGNGVVDADGDPVGTFAGVYEIRDEQEELLSSDKWKSKWFEYLPEPGIFERGLEFLSNLAGGFRNLFP